MKCLRRLGDRARDSFDARLKVRHLSVTAARVVNRALGLPALLRATAGESRWLAELEAG